MALVSFQFRMQQKENRFVNCRGGGLVFAVLYVLMVLCGAVFSADAGFLARVYIYIWLIFQPDACP